MRTRVFAIIVTTLALLTMGVWLTRSHLRESTGSSSQRGATASAIPQPAASDDWRLDNRRKETSQERRARMISNEANRDDFQLSEQEVYLYVQNKGSNALSLVAAFESTRNKDYLKAAAEKFPNDPFVQAKALMWLDLSDEERAKMLDAFKVSAPTNAFANFMAARDAVKRGDAQTAFKEVMAAKGKGYDEFDRQSAEGLVEAYSSAGRSLAEAKTLGMSEVTLPQLAEFKKIGREFKTLADDAAVKGDLQTQQEMLLATWTIGDRMRNGGTPSTIITELVGIAIENLTLRSLPAGAEFNGRLASDLVAENQESARSLRSGTPIFEKWFPTAPEDEIVKYVDTTLTSGERDAIAWLKERHPELALVPPSK